MKTPPISLIFFVVVLGLLLQLAVSMMVNEQRERPISIALIAIAAIFPGIYGVIVGYRQGYDKAKNDRGNGRDI